MNVSINKLFKDELKKSYTKYCIDQLDIKARFSQENLINWVAEVWSMANCLLRSLISHLKKRELLWHLIGAKKKKFISHNQLLNDDQVMVDQVEQPIDEQDEEMKNAGIDYKSNNLEENDENEKRQLI